MSDERGRVAEALADQARLVRGSGRFRIFEVTSDGYYAQVGSAAGNDVEIELFADGLDDDSDAARHLLALGFTAPHDDSANWTLQVPDAADDELDEAASALLSALTETLGVPLEQVDAVLAEVRAKPELTVVEIPAGLRPTALSAPGIDDVDDDSDEVDDDDNPLIESYRGLAEALWDEPLPADSSDDDVLESVLSGLESYGQVELRLEVGSDSFLIEPGEYGVGHSFPLRLHDVLDSVDDLSGPEYEPDDQYEEFDEFDVTNPNLGRPVPAFGRQPAGDDGADEPDEDEPAPGDAGPREPGLGERSAP